VESVKVLMEHNEYEEGFYLGMMILRIEIEEKNSTKFDNKLYKVH
jgi:hypothetical protein